MDYFNHHFIRFRLKRALTLQTVIRFPRETRRRFAVPKSDSFTPVFNGRVLDSSKRELYSFFIISQRTVAQIIFRWL